MAKILTLTPRAGDVTTVSQSANKFVISGTPNACLSWMETNVVTREQIVGFSAVSVTSVVYAIIK